MAYKISVDCVRCGACEPECPVSCINSGIEKNPKYEGPYIIDESQCIECGACANVCPVDAPKPE